MTEYLKSVRPVGPTSPGLTKQDEVVGDAVEPSVRQLLSELAHLEDMVRAAGYSVDDPGVFAALAREQEIIAELHHRNPRTDSRWTGTDRKPA